MSDRDPPTAVDGGPITDIVFGDGEIGDFFSIGGLEGYQAGHEILMVGGEENNAAFSHHGDYRLKKTWVVRDDIKL